MTPAECAAAATIRQARSDALAHIAKVQGIVREVATATGISTAEINSATKGPKHVQKARWLVMAMARDRGLTLVQIGVALGRDHTTVLHGIRKHRGAQ